MTHRVVQNGGHADDVLVALDALLVMLRESTQRNQASTRRAQTIRRLRSHGRGYPEILHRVAGAATTGVTRENANRLAEASEQLQAAEVRALGSAGVSAMDIAGLCAITVERAAELLGTA